MSNLIRHPYHLVDESPWPLLMSFGGFLVTSGMVFWFYSLGKGVMFVSIIGLVLVSFQWWNDVSSEATFQGHHSSVVQLGMRWGMVLFIISEIFFFLSFFWAFFHSSLGPSVAAGASWPPVGVFPFNWMKVPLLNTLILLSSGVSVTWAHHSMMAGNYSSASSGLLMTVGLGVYFSGVQGFEYVESSFSIADSSFGSCFFIATGFHGLHVIVGTVFLVVTGLRHSKAMFSSDRHFGFEAASWYWHFVDVVWLFLFLTVYWWGS